MSSISLILFTILLNYSFAMQPESRNQQMDVLDILKRSKLLSAFESIQKRDSGFHSNLFCSPVADLRSSNSAYDSDVAHV
jgi:hypothetical protein